MYTNILTEYIEKIEIRWNSLGDLTVIRSLGQMPMRFLPSLSSFCLWVSLRVLQVLYAVRVLEYYGSCFRVDVVHASCKLGMPD